MRVERIIGLLIILLGAGYLAGALAINQPPAYAAVGPRTIPIGIGIGIALSGLWLILAPGNPPGPLSDQRVALDWRTISLVVLLLLGYALALRPLGFILTNSFFIVLTAQVLGERRHLLRDALVAIAFAVAAYTLFAHGLRIQLPDALPETWLDAAIRSLRP